MGSRSWKYRGRRRRRFSLLNTVVTFVCFGGLIYLVAFLDKQNTQQIDGRAHVVDGDSLTLNGENIRLRGVDAPEFNQECDFKGEIWPCGRHARLALRRKIANKSVDCGFDGRDQYDRLLAVCRVGETELNAWLVQSGWAVDFGGYAREEATARRGKAGIWKGGFENPQEWRRANNEGGSFDRSQGNWKMSDWIEHVKTWFE